VLTKLLNKPAAQRAAASMLGFYLHAALATTRWTLDGEANLAPFVLDTPVIAAFWHECLPLMPAMWRHVRRRNNQRRAVMLVSRHRDGRFIAAIMARFHLRSVHGSTGTAQGNRLKNRGGAAGLRGMLAALDAGDAVVLTPDGPRGPARQAAQGVSHVAALSGAPVLPMAARMRHRLRLRSWDRMLLPLPFGRGVLVCLPAITVSPGGARDAHSQIEAALTAASARAEALLA
jgi:lysophospholipid acyltransferase (LPLAT)-like uncharacterized protein